MLDKMQQQRDENDRALAETIIVMASKMGIVSIAEGVETEAQYKMLDDFGCDFVQGYLFCKPLPEQDFYQLISHKSHRSKVV
jgi:EAL domain-containing protein (putative c-di-GMP-specific phosphodiesterase class I)